MIHLNYNLISFSILILLFASCKSEMDPGTMENWKNEILEAERAFAKMAKEEGISEAFLHFAAEDAVLMRNQKLIIGKSNLQEYFNQQSSPENNVQLTWEPDFIDVAQSGDMGYTYGQFIFSYPDSTGTILENKGVFHTVWKRQEDGSWKYVWD